MFLAKIDITDRRLLTDFYAMHRFIYNLYPHGKKKVNRADPQAAAILYRLEKGPAPYVLVQSRVAPMWGDIKEFEPNLRQGNRYWFRLRANATRKNEQGKRVAVHPVEEQMEWLALRTEARGFSCTQVNIIERPGVTYAEKDPTLADIAINPVVFEGLLRVDNPDLFGQTLTCGLGSAKGFGCGLISLAQL